MTNMRYGSELPFFRRTSLCLVPCLEDCFWLTHICSNAWKCHILEDIQSTHAGTFWVLTRILKCLIVAVSLWRMFFSISGLRCSSSHSLLWSIAQSSQLHSRELITFGIQAAERLRLMIFSNRLIHDYFVNVVNFSTWHSELEELSCGALHTYIQHFFLHQPRCHSANEWLRMDHLWILKKELFLNQERKNNHL